jgi:predicted AAA+ superfamily ATPase
MHRLYFGRDIHKLMENAVFQQLRILGYEVYVGKLKNLEIDFVGIKDGNKVYVQVAYLIVDEKTHEREFGNLLKIDNNFPKYVVTMDTFNSISNYKGIHHLHLREFLKLEKL